ncbi:MAG: glycosyltransferase, partial [Chloroflexota bacterium]|nr:glycosyltransferase [Chloroflexota bacterium]
PGVSSHADLANAMRAARGFVQHSVQAFSGDSEGTPVAVLEAGASGLPVVATRHAGIPDVVVEGETGFLVDEGDVHAMAEGMVRLASMPDLAGRMGAAARKRIEEHFSMEKSIANLWRIITSAMEPQA